MALLRKFFHRKPPEGLLEISERVFVFDCCFTTTLLEGNEYQVYIGRIVDRLREYLSDVSFMVFNFGDGNNKSQINNVASEYGMTVMDYPCQYVNCPLLTLEMIDHFLKSSESWLSIGQRNVLLIHCQNGAFQILAFVLAAFLISRNQCTGEQKTLDMIYKQASQELLQLLPSLNSLPSQLRYLQYVSRRNIGSKWPPLNKALMLDCVILRVIPNMDGKGGCRPIFRIYGPDPFMDATWTTKMLFSMPQKSKVVEYFKQADCELVKIEINCHVQGDVVLECISLDDNLEHEEMMFHVMFNTAFIQSNILMLNHEEIDVSWNVKNQMPKDFRAEVRFSEMDTSSSLVGLDLFCIQDKEGHPIEAFAKVQDIYSNLLDVGDSETHNAIENGMSSPSAVLSETSSASPKSSLDSGCTTKKIESNELQVSVQRHPQYKIISPRISQSSLSIPASYSNSLQGSSVALSRYRSAPSVLGITALLHDHAEFNNKELCCPSILESSISASAPCILKPVQPTDSSVSPPPEQHPSEKHFINIKSGSKVPPPPPSPPPPRPLLLSAGSLTTQPPIRQLSSSQSLAVPLAPPPPPPPPRIQSTRQLHASELLDSLSSEPVSSLFMLSWQQPPPSLSLLPSVVLSSPPPPPPPPPLPVLSNSNLSPSQLPNTPCNHDPRMSGDIGQWLPPLPPPPPSLISAPANSLSSNCDSLSIPHTASLPYLAIIPTPSIDLSHTTSTPSLPTPLSEEAETSFTNQSLVPSSPPPSSYPSSVTTTLPCLPNTLSACPPPPPPLPRIGTAKPPFLSSIPSPVPLLSSSLTTNASSSPRILPSVTCPLPPIPLLTASPPSLRDSAVLPGPLPPSSNVLTVQNSSSIIPPPPTPPRSSSSTICQDSSLLRTKRPTVPATPPRRAGSATVSTSKCSAPPPPCPPSSIQKESSSRSHQVVPPPPAPLSDGLSKASCPSLHMHSSLSAPLGAKGKLQSWTSTRIQAQSKKTSLKPYHWLKLTRVMQGSLWAEAQQPEEVSKAPELDMSELESLFSATITSSDHGGANGKINRRGSGLKHDKVHLIELRRAYNCEIMLTKVKVPLSDLMNSILTLDDSALDIDQVDNLIKFCPTKEEIELLKNYKGDKENLGKCEKFFLELMKVLRVESKLRVFSFKIQFFSQVSDLSSSLNIVNSASEEVRKSVKLKRIMQTILSLGNALNHGTARGSAVGFRLDSLLKLTETRARNNKTTLMHYLCKVLTAKLPEVLDFHKDLVSLEAATKIQLKYLAEEMQAISKGLEKVVQELTASENDGAVSEHFCKTLKEFFASAEVEVRSLASLYSGVGRNADALAFYFGEDPARCPFEQVVSTLLNFVRMFRRAQEENCKQLEFEKKKAQKEAEIGKAKMNAARKDLDNENMLSSSARISEIQSHP